MQLIRFSLLVSLIASSLSTDDFWDVAPLPSGCKASLRHSDRFGANLKYFDCEAAGLTEIPAGIPLDSQIVNLRGNRISRVSRLDGLQELLHLDLSHNELTSLEYSSDTSFSPFELLSRLAVLDLHSNPRLTSLPSGIFAGLTGLTELDLADCRLNRLSPEDLVGLPALRILRLAGNRLTSFPIVVDLPSLHQLHLERNFLSTLTSDNFASLPSLVRLDLSRNRLSGLPSQWLSGLERLEKLRLDNNRLTGVPMIPPSVRSLSLGGNLIGRLPAGSFAGLGSLTDLSLVGSGRLRMIDRGAFTDLPGLLVCHLQDCPQLSYLDSAAFQNCPALTHLLLHGGNLTTVDRRLITSLPSLVEFSFYSNPLGCDCHSQWLWHLATGTADPVGSFSPGLKLAEADRLVCDSPGHLKFRLLGSLTSSDMTGRAAACPPVVFADTSDGHRSVPDGTDVTLECRAVGHTQIVWSGPDGRQLATGGTLALRSVRKSAAGRYVCAATNDAGQTAQVAVDLEVLAAPVRIWPIRVGPGEVLLGLSGATRPQRLLIRTGLNGRHIQAGLVSPLMSSIRLSRLSGATPFEVCLANQNDDEILTDLRCCHFATPPDLPHFDALQTVKSTNVAVGAALAIAACLLAAVCLAAIGLQRRRQDVVNRPFLPHCYADVTPNFYGKLPTTKVPKEHLDDYITGVQYESLSYPQSRHMSTATDVTDID